MMYSPLARCGTLLVIAFLSLTLAGFSFSPVNAEESEKGDGTVLLTFESRAAVQAVVSSDITCSSLHESGIIEMSMDDDIWVSCIAADRVCSSYRGVNFFGQPVFGPEPIIE